VRFRQADGSWHSREDLEAKVEPTPDQRGWQPLVIPVTIPDGAAEMMVMPGAGGQATGATALFDDLAAYRLP
jgi:hypothetical protein